MFKTEEERARILDVAKGAGAMVRGLAESLRVGTWGGDVADEDVVG